MYPIQSCNLLPAGFNHVYLFMFQPNFLPTTWDADLIFG